MKECFYKFDINKVLLMIAFFVTVILPFKVYAIAIGANAPFSENLTPASNVNLINGSKYEPDDTFGEVLKTQNTSYASINSFGNISAKEGTITIWIKPLWSGDGIDSHTILSMSWDHPKNSYLALSWGWWEPIGIGRLYFIASNQDFVNCSTPYKLDRNEWSFVTAVWKSGQDGYCKLYINGSKIAGAKANFNGNYNSKGPIYLGSDIGTTERKGRLSDMLFHKLTIQGSGLTDQEVKELYVKEGQNAGISEAKKTTWMNAELPNSAKAIVNPDNFSKENRVIFDEDIRWARSEKDTDEILNNIKSAGFNIYIPCIWHGLGTYYPSNIANYDARLGDRIRRGEDPLRYLLDKAHSIGIKVHPWFTVVRRENDDFKDFYDNGSPNLAFDVHNPKFRDFIINLMTDVVDRYPVDGVNLDYIRSVGFCSSSKCADEYQQKYGRNLNADIMLIKVPGLSVNTLIDWNTKAVSSIVEEFHRKAKLIKPELIISVDAHPLNKDLILQGQDSISWANNNWIDIIFNMDYKERLDVENADKVRALLQNPEKMTMLISLFDLIDEKPVKRSPEVMSKYINFIREKWPNTGIAFYHYPQLSRELIESLHNVDFKIK